MKTASVTAGQTRPAQREVFPVVFVGHVDHGKSTLIGRILYETGAVPEEKLRELKSISGKRGLANEWSFLLDALQIERDQGITLDTTQVWFPTNLRTYRAIDAPGHAEFVRNMATGASAADAAVLVVDAQQGIGEQTRRHAAVLQLLGLRQVVVAANKMDLCGFDPVHFASLAKEITGLLEDVGISAAAIVPLSARSGDNVRERSDETPWYGGPALLEALDGFISRRPPAEAPLRIVVQDVYRRGDRRAIAGRIESGRLKVGDTIRIVPSGRLARVVEFADWNRQVSRISATAGESVALFLDTQAFVERGSWITDPDTSPDPAEWLEIRLLWLADESLSIGRKLRLSIGAVVRDASVTAVTRVLEPGIEGQANSGGLTRNGVAVVKVRLVSPMPVDRFVEFPSTGRGIIQLGDAIAGGFIVERMLSSPAANDIHPVRSTVAISEREQRNGHRGGVFWLTGLSGSGKSTLATLAQRQLFDSGIQVHILDGDTLRVGLNSDLGFSIEDRSENVRRTAHVAKLLAECGTIVIVALISPLQVHRDLAREIIGSAFQEIHIRAGLETCQRRDPKGLYERAANGSIALFTGVSAPYEVPAQPDLVLDTDELSTESGVSALISFIRRKTMTRSLIH